MKIEHIKKNLMHNEYPAVVINVKYPEFSFPEDSAFERKINKYYKSLSSAYTKFAETDLYKIAKLRLFGNAKENSEQPKPYSALFDFKITYTDELYICLYTNATVYLGEGRGNIKRSVQLWDKKKRTIVKPARAFALGSADKKAVLEEIYERIESGDGYYYNNLSSDDLRRHIDLNNACLTNTGCTLFFPQKSIAPHVMGIIEFEIKTRYSRINNPIEA